MEIPFFLFLLVIYLILKNSKKPEHAKKIYVCWVTVLLCLLSALRNVGVGNDTYEYLQSFDDVVTVPWSELYGNIFDYYLGVAIKDPGYNILQRAFHLVSDNFAFFQFCVSLLFISAISRIIFKTVENMSGYIISYTFYLSLFYNYLPNSATRQTIAMGMLLWAIILWIERRKILWPVLLIITASTIHKSVLLGFLPIALSYVNKPKIIFKCAVIACPLIFFFGKPVAEYMAVISAADHYVGYVTDNGESSRPVAFILEMIVFYVLGLCRISDLNSKNRYMQFGIVCFSLSISFVSFIWVNSNLMRVVAYFSLWGIVYLPRVISCYHLNSRKLVYTIILFLLVSRIAFVNRPYKFFWQDMVLNERYE